MIRKEHYQPAQVYNCVTQRQHFNYLRNNSCGIWGTFSWNNSLDNIHEQYQNTRAVQDGPRSVPQNELYSASNSLRPQSQEKKNRQVSFEEGSSAAKPRSPEHPQKPASAKQQAAKSFERKSRLKKDQQAEKLKQEENHRKVQEYIEGQIPYTRSMSNSKFQQYYGKPAPQCYGRANTNEPIGGVIYGNHLKTFNVNPHVAKNKPEHYQTHTTALNFGKRTKHCSDVKWKNLERQLSKKLGLKDKNQTVKEGKEVVYVDVDDNNMYDAMKQNHEFAKANRDAIHSNQIEFKKQKHVQHLDDMNQFYAKKKAKIGEGLQNQSTLASAGQGVEDDDPSRLNEQIIYKYHDKDGNIRYAGNRHAVTCFVDLNFPENEPIYTEELKNRMPIFPIKTRPQDQNIDAIRRQNCKKGRQSVYPSHYLIRNCQEPEVLKMLNNKSGFISRKAATASAGNAKAANKAKPNANKSFSSTNYTRKQRQANPEQAEQTNVSGEFSQQPRPPGDSHLDQNNFSSVKSQIMQRAFNDQNLVNEIRGRAQTCCEPKHMPHNQLNPQCYKNASGIISRIPYAG